MAVMELIGSWVYWVYGSKGRPCRAGDVWTSRRRRCGGKASEAEGRARPRGLETGAWRGSSESYNWFRWCRTFNMILGSLTFTKWHVNLQAELHLKCTSQTACRVEKSLEVSEGRWQRQEWNRDQWGDCCCQARGDEDLDLGGGRWWDVAELQTYVKHKGNEISWDSTWVLKERI